MKGVTEPFGPSYKNESGVLTDETPHPPHTKKKERKKEKSKRSLSVHLFVALYNFVKSILKLKTSLNLKARLIIPLSGPSYFNAQTTKFDL